MSQNWCIDVRGTKSKHAGVLIRLLCLCSSNITICIWNVRRQQEQLKGAESSPENRSLSSDKEDASSLQSDNVYQTSYRVSLGNNTMQHDGSNFSTDTNIKTPFITMKMSDQKCESRCSRNNSGSQLLKHTQASQELDSLTAPKVSLLFKQFSGSSAAQRILSASCSQFEQNLFGLLAHRRRTCS